MHLIISRDEVLGFILMRGRKGAPKVCPVTAARVMDAAMGGWALQWPGGRTEYNVAGDVLTFATLEEFEQHLRAKRDGMVNEMVKAARAGAEGELSH